MVMRYSVVAVLLAAAPVCAADLSPSAELGKALFFDPQLSFNGNESCAFCHDPTTGFSSPHGQFNRAGGVVEGSFAGRFGNRRPPTAAYAAFAPVFHHTFEDGEVLFVGGAFLDGRATGARFGNPAADQALMPFLNPVEMALPDEVCLVQKVCAQDAAGAYPLRLGAIWGAEICQIDLPEAVIAACADGDDPIAIEDEALAQQIDAAAAAIGLSIMSYEMSPEMVRFSSRYDRYVAGDESALTAQEKHGRELFEGKALCAECHVTGPGPHGRAALFTDFTYDNLGVPRNPQNPYYMQAAYNADGVGYVDLGLGGYLRKDPIYGGMAEAQDGKQKVPTLRNLTAGVTPDNPRAYMHNGYFHTLEGVVRFYNKRDVWPRCAEDLLTEAEALAQQCWPAAEVPATVNKDELGNLKLDEAEEADLVAFLRTLDDE